MKKFLALLLALIMCVGVLTACNPNNSNGDETDAGASTVEDAKALLTSMMKDDNGKATPNDYDVVAKLVIGETSFDVTWTTNNENVKVKASSKTGFWTIDVPDVNAAEVEYKIIATIKAADGSTANAEFTRKLPVVDNAGVETEFKAGVAYKMFMKQANLGYTVYALNTTQDDANKFINTTLDPKAAAVSYVEVVEGGYKIYTEINGVKNYLHATATPKETGTGFTKAIGFATETTCVFTYDATLALFKVKLSGEEFGVGTYNAFETISLSEAKYFKADNVNVAGGQFPIGLYTAEYADTLAPSVKPENTDPAENSTLTIAEAIALGKTKVKDQYTSGKYYVTGTIKEIQKEEYGNLVITDGTNDLLVYGSYSADGKTGFKNLDPKPQVGDTITVYGIIGMYNDAQMKNGWIQGAGSGSGNQGGSTTPSVNTAVVDAPVAGTAYKFGMVQTAAGKTVYLKGGMEGYYMATTENAAEAIDVYLEATTNGYYFYTMSGSTKTYINMVVSGTHVNGAYEATASTVYTIDAALKTIVSTVNVSDADAVYCFGTRSDKTYTTAGPVNTANEPFMCQFYTVVEGGEGNEGGDTPVNPPVDTPACENHADNDGDFVCDTEACNVVVEPAADSVLTLEQANALGVLMGSNTTTNKYYVTGTIDEVYNTQYGNMYIKDANGVKFTVYGVDGYSAMANKPVAGDVITVYAGITSYSGKAQMKNAEMTDLQHEHAFENGECACGAADPDYVPTHTCEDGDDDDFICDNADCTKVVLPAADSVLTLDQANALGVLLNGEYTTDKYYIIAIIKDVYSTNYGNMYVKNDSGVEFTVYGTYSADGTVQYKDLATKPVAGDTVKIYGIIGSYNGAAQMKNGWIVEHIAHGDNHNYVDGVCTVCGAAKPIEGATTLNIVMSDVAAANSWADATKYTSFAADSNVTVSVTGGGNTGKYYNNGSNWRIYQNESPTITIAAANSKTIKTVKISYTVDKTGVLTLNGNQIATATVVNVDAASITFGVGNTGTATNGQVRITAIEIVYQ